MVEPNKSLEANPGDIKPAINKLFLGKWEKRSIPEKWDSNEAEGIDEVFSNVII